MINYRNLEVVYMKKKRYNLVKKDLLHKSY